MNEYKMKLKWRTFHSTTSFFYEIYFNIVFLFLIYRSLISHFLFPKISSIFFFHLCESNNFEIKKRKKSMPIYYTMSIDSQIYPRQRFIFPTMQPQFPARKRAISEEKRKRRGEKKKKSAWPTSLSRNTLDAFEIILGFDLFVAQLPLVPRHHEEASFFARFSRVRVFYECTNKDFEGKVLPMAREK